MKIFAIRRHVLLLNRSVLMIDNTKEIEEIRNHFRDMGENLNV